MNNNSLILLPFISVQPHFIAMYKQPYFEGGRCYKREYTRYRPKTNDHKGLISNHSASKIKKAIHWLLLIARDKTLSSSFHGKNFNFKLSFITLTLSSKQIHSDNEIKAILLNQFLVESRKKWGVRSYLWRAEPQKNGNIHFHILTDKFIPWSELRDTWNRIQNKLGYVDRYRNEMKQFHAGGFNVRQDLLKTWDYKKQVRAYRTGSRQDWNSPNSTDVHSIRNISNLPAYLSKYCTKNESGRKIEGQLWGLSESLSKLKGVCELITNDIAADISSIAALFPNNIRTSQYFTVIFVSYYLWSKHVKGEIYRLFNNYIYDIQASANAP